MKAARPRRNAEKPDALAGVARAVIATEVGGKIPTVQQLQGSIGVGSGTVVKALRALEDSGAVEVDAAGHLGTLVRDRNLGLLWQAAKLGNLHLQLTPPGPVEQHGLVAAIRDTMGEAGIAVLPAFVPGAARRLQALADGKVHGVTTSMGAFLQHRAEYPQLRGIDLGPRTYYADGSITVVECPAPSGRVLRVGIDRGSDDHSLLTEAEFRSHPDAVFVDCSFVEGPAAVLQGRIDAVIWHRQPAIIPPELAGLTVRPTTVSATNEVLDRASRAVLVVREGDTASWSVLQLVTPARVRRHQRRLAAVVGNSSLPHEALWME